MARISAISPEADPISIKDILRAGHILLQPPEPLPTDLTILRSRVNEAHRFLTYKWDERLYLSTEGCNSVERDVEDVRQSERNAITLIGPRCLDLLLGLQSVLVREFWPADARGEYEARNFILGTADLRLVRLMITHSLSLIKSQSESYLTSLITGRSDPEPPLKLTLHALFSLLGSTPQPPSPGPSAPRRLPPTTITQLLTISHLPPILLSSILLGYTPSLRAPVHADIRRSFLGVLNEVSPSQAISALSSIRPLLSPSPESVAIRYPEYIQTTINLQLSAQLLRTGGPLGLLLNLFGERALSDAEPIDEKKVDHAITALCRLPAGAEEGRYVRHVMGECMAILGAPRPGQGKAPRAFRLVAAGVVGRMVPKYPDAKGAVQQRLRCITGEEDEEEEGMKEKWEALELLNTLVNHLDPSMLPAFLEDIVRPLGSTLLRLAESPSTENVQTSKRDKHDAVINMRVNELAEDILRTWMSVSPKTSMSDMDVSPSETTPDDLNRLTRTFSRLRTSSGTTLINKPSSLSEIDRLNDLFISTKDPPNRVEAISQLAKYLEDPLVSPVEVKCAVKVLIQGVEDEEAFVHLKAISALSSIAGRHGHIISEAVELAYLDQMDQLRQSQAVEKGSEGRVLRLAEALIGVQRSLTRRNTDREPGTTRRLRDKVEEFTQDRRLSETVRMSSRAVLDCIS